MLLGSISLVTQERLRQIYVEGWTPAHDKFHQPNDLSRAALCYILKNINSEIIGFDDIWPWETDYFKPEDEIRNLVKAAALIMAEIDKQLAEENELI